MGKHRSGPVTNTVAVVAIVWLAFLSCRQFLSFVR